MLIGDINQWVRTPTNGKYNTSPKHSGVRTLGYTAKINSNNVLFIPFVTTLEKTNSITHNSYFITLNFDNLKSFLEYIYYM